MAKETEVIVDVKYKTEDAQEKMRVLAEETKRLQEQNKALQDSIKNLSKDDADYSKKLAENTAQLQKNKDELKLVKVQQEVLAQSTYQETELTQELGDSFKELNAKMLLLEKQYKSMSRAERESAEGKELYQSLMTTKNEVKALNESMGNFQMNVGNYPKTVGGVFQQIGQSMKEGAMGAKSFGGAIIGAAKGAGSALKALMLNPVGLWIAGITAVVAKLVQAFKRNDDASTSLQKSLASFKPILTAINVAFDYLAQAVAKAVEWASKLFDLWMKYSPMGIALSAILGKNTEEFEKEAQAEKALVEATDKLEDTEREYLVNSAKRSKEVAEIRDKVAQKDRFSAQEREQMLLKAQALEKANMDEQKAIVAEKLRLLQAEAKRNADTSDEMKNKIAQARAEMLNTEREYFAGIKRLEKELVTARKEQAEEEERIVKEQAEQQKKLAEERKARLKAEQTALEEYEAQARKLIKDEGERAVAEVKASGKKRTDALRKQLEEDKTLTKTARKAIQDTIVLIEQETESQVKEIQDKASKEQFYKALEEETKRLEAQAKLADDKSKERYDFMMSAFDKYAEEIKNREGLLEEERLALLKENDLKRADWQKQFREQFQQEEGEGTLEEKLEAERLELEELRNLSQEDQQLRYESKEAYTQAMIELENRITDNEKKQLEQRRKVFSQQAQNLASTVSSFGDSMTSLFNSLAGDSEEYAKFEKAMAIAQSAVQLGLAIAKATTVATEGDPYTVAIRVAAAVASVTAAFASMVATIKSATIPKAPKFAGGGIVEGTSYQGDLVQARLNSGEMVLNRTQQAKLFQLANADLHSAVSGSFYSQTSLADQLALALERMPAPVMVYSEFQAFNEGREKVIDYTTIK